MAKNLNCFHMHTNSYQKIPQNGYSGEKMTQKTEQFCKNLTPE